MSLEVVLNDHSRQRIKERMSITPEEVTTFLLNGAYAEVATVDSFYINKYLVFWEKKTNRSFLFILKKQENLWELVTVFETYKYQRRKDGVTIQGYDLHQAKCAMQKYCNSQITSTREKAAKRALSTLCLDLLVWFRSDTQVITARRKTVGKIKIEDFEKRFGTDYRKWFVELVSEGVSFDMNVPTDATISYEIYHPFRTGKKVVFFEDL